MVTGQPEHGLVRACPQAARVSEGSAPLLLSQHYISSTFWSYSIRKALWNPLASGGHIHLGLAKKKQWTNLDMNQHPWGFLDILGEWNSKRTGLPAGMHATLNCVVKDVTAMDHMRTCFSRSLWILLWLFWILSLLELWSVICFCTSVFFLGDLILHFQWLTGHFYIYIISNSICLKPTPTKNTCKPIRGEKSKEQRT